MIKLLQEQQVDVIKHIAETRSSYAELLSTRKNKMQYIYEETTTFKNKKERDRDTEFKVNKCFEIENKILPRVIAKNPKWIVSKKTDEFDIGDIDLPPDERAKKDADFTKFTLAIRDYLEYVFDKKDIKEVVKLGAKQAIRYGLSFGKVGYRYEIGRDSENTIETDVDEYGMQKSRKTKKVKEEVIGEYPSIDIVKWKDILFDPRYVRLEDMPAILEQVDSVRLSYFTKKKKNFMNIDRLIEYAKCPYESDPHGYTQRVYAITGIMPSKEGKVDTNNLSVTKYYGYYDFDKEGDGTGERLYECWVVNDCIVVYAEQISQIPFEDMKCFEDTETHFATGYLEPIIGLQRELNFKKNSASVYINQSLNRSFVWSPNSGINPRSLKNISAPGAIIPTTKSATEALENLVEFPHRQLPPQYFQEQNDFERQIQGLSFTVDASSNNTGQALTNTATGMRLKAMESTSVSNMVRDNFESWLTRLAYKLLQATFDNLEDNIVIKKMGGKGFWEVNKEAMRDAMRRYDIKIEPGTSSFDTLEEKRADAIAQWNLSQQAKQIGIPVDLKAQFKRLMGTFEGVDTDKLLDPMADMMGPAMGQPMGQQPLPPLTTPQQPSGISLPAM